MVHVTVTDTDTLSFGDVSIKGTSGVMGLSMRCFTISKTTLETLDRNTLHALYDYFLDLKSVSVNDESETILEICNEWYAGTIRLVFDF